MLCTLLVFSTSCYSSVVQKNNKMIDSNLSKATFGGGCFWCTEAIFQELKGVDTVISGYMGGQTLNPTYKEVCSGISGHAEVIHIVYDSTLVSYATLLEIFWKTHDPTTLNRQGADAGTQYRSVVFYYDEEQKNVAGDLKKELGNAQIWSDPIVTEISEASTFYPAEEYHQNYYKENGGSNGYCRVVITPKVEKFKKVFSAYLK